MMMQMGLLGLAYVFSDTRYRTHIRRVFAFALQKE